MDIETPKGGSRMKRFRPRLTYANVIASLALFVALGGSAVAAGLAKNTVGPNQLKQGAVTAGKIRKQAVTSGKIAPKAVTAGKLGPNKITNNAVTTQKLAASAVGTNNLAEGSVTGAKIAKETITAEKLAKGAIGNVETLKTGQTERGVFNVGGYNPAVGKEVNGVGAINFPLLLASNPTVIVVKGTAFTPQCPGLGAGGTTPEALAGYVCVYLTAESNLDATTPLTATGTRLGVNLTAKGDKEKEGNFVATGVWATTAP
jgi:hypothetical protein